MLCRDEKEIKLLLVDDDIDFIILTKHGLEKQYPYLNIVYALSGRLALEKIQEENFDLVLSDYDMPEMNGLEFLTDLRGRGCDIPFIFLTGQGNEMIAIEALRQGANDYFRKDEQFAHYYRIVNSIIRQVENYRKGLDRKKIEMELAESEERLRQLVFQMPFPVQVFDAEGNAVLVNEKFIEVFGITEGESIVGGYNILEDPIMDKLDLKESARKAYQGETVFIPHVLVPVELLNTNKYGIQKYGVLIFEVEMFPVFRKSGEIWNTVLILKDITERNQLEDALDEMERKYRMASDSPKSAVLALEMQLESSLFGNSVNRMPNLNLGSEVDTYKSGEISEFNNREIDN